MAMAAQVPNCCWVSPSKWPSGGKRKSATAFSTKMVAKETDIWASFALAIGPVAAMALPPQMAVPLEMR